MSKQFLLEKFLPRLLVFANIFIASAALAVDKDDFYANFYGGFRFDDRIQAGASLGYAPINSAGAALLFDGTRSITQISLEPRWFLEPFEFAVGIGISRDHSAGNENTSRLLLSFSGAYLWALTSSLAVRAELRGQYLVKGTSSALASLGGRLVF